MVFKDFNELPDLRKEYSSETLVFCTGSFDLVHAGHALFFEECKGRGDKLIVCVAGDYIIQKHKGAGRPIMNQHVRQKMIDSLKPVDFTILDDFTYDNSDPLYAVKLGLDALRPDIYVINEDAFDVNYRTKLCNEFGVKLAILPRTCPENFQDISTSKIIETIQERSLANLL